MLIMIGLLFILPMIGTQFGMNLDLVGWLLRGPVDWTIGTILRFTGLT